ncbi:MAG: phosphotransferase [Chloroflexi bacterium]|nr:phosphotransferase [Chloroflexota bacterium]
MAAGGARVHRDRPPRPGVTDLVGRLRARTPRRQAGLRSPSLHRTRTAGGGGGGRARDRHRRPGPHRGREGVRRGRPRPPTPVDDRPPRGRAPADLIEWLAGHAHQTANQRAAELVSSIAGQRHRLGFSVVYGDPSPEILLAAEGTAALIDWGTPSWGPQLHDVAAWLRRLGERPGEGSEREGRFLASYGRPIDPGMLELFGRCANAFGF